MIISPTRDSVDGQGLITVPYLTTWTPSNTVHELTIILSSVFSATPPVHAKPTAAATTKLPQVRQSESIPVIATRVTQPITSVYPIVDQKRQLIDKIKCRLQTQYTTFYEALAGMCVEGREDIPFVCARVGVYRYIV